MGTPLQAVYDAFFLRLDEQICDKDKGLIYSIFIVAVENAKRAAVNSLGYVLDEPEENHPAELDLEEGEDEDESYSGYFIEALSGDEINLIALWMLYEWNRRKLQRLLGQRRDIGTADFNRIPSKKEELAVIEFGLKHAKSDIVELEQAFNEYKN